MKHPQDMSFYEFCKAFVPSEKPWHPLLEEELSPQHKVEMEIAITRGEIKICSSNAERLGLNTRLFVLDEVKYDS